MKAAAKRAAGALLALVLAVIVPWPQPALAAGALAVALPQNVVKDGFSYGSAYNYQTEEEARTRALERCRGTKSEFRRKLCTVVASFKGQCLAVAMDPKDGTPGVGWSLSESQEVAERHALAKCKATAGPGRRDACRIEQGAGCDTVGQSVQAATPPPATQQQAAIPPPTAPPQQAAPQESTPPRATTPSATTPRAGARVALVIGNSAYTSLPKIPNPRNDAEDLAKSLTALGFEVAFGADLKRVEMEEIMIRFGRQARQADTALVYYAGHGIQHNGANYLAPVDARIEDEADLRKLINLQDVIDDLRNSTRVRILIVDACRDNKVVAQLSSRVPATRAAAFTRGLARVDGADGTLVAFATQPNRLAADGDGRNSPFTRALLKHLPTPGLEVRTLMARVRAEVVDATAGAQRPEVWDSLVGEFAFRAGP
jgi:hypothetical protein